METQIENRFEIKSAAEVLDSKTAHTNPFPMHIQDHMSLKESKIEIKQKKYSKNQNNAYQI